MSKPISAMFLSRCLKAQTTESITWRSSSTNFCGSSGITSSIRPTPGRGPPSAMRVVFPLPGLATTISASSRPGAGGPPTRPTQRHGGAGKRVSVITQTGAVIEGLRRDGAGRRDRLVTTRTAIRERLALPLPQCHLWRGRGYRDRLRRGGPPEDGTAWARGELRETALRREEGGHAVARGLQRLRVRVAAGKPVCFAFQSVVTQLFCLAICKRLRVNMWKLSSREPGLQCSICPGGCPGLWRRNVIAFLISTLFTLFSTPLHP